MHWTLIQRIVFVVFLIGTSSFALSQEDFETEEVELVFYADAMINASAVQNRVLAHDIFFERFMKVLEKDSSFYNSFDQLKWISKWPKNESANFRIFTWQIADSPETKYYGVVQYRDGSIMPLKDGFNAQNADIEYEMNSINRWFGQLYYNCIPLETDSKTYYLLFGYRQISEDRSLKCVETMEIKDGHLHFSPINFKSSTTDRHGMERFLLEYTTTSSAQLNFDEVKKLIYFDEITTVFAPGDQNKALLVPTGIVDGFVMEGSEWIFVKSLFDISKHPEQKVHDNVEKKESRDIFGRIQKK